MRIFEHPNVTIPFVCPICRTNADRPIVLIGIAGTEDGFNMEAKQVHADCLSNTLRIIEDTPVRTVIAAFVRRDA